METIAAIIGCFLTLNYHSIFIDQSKQLHSYHVKLIIVLCQTNGTIFPQLWFESYKTIGHTDILYNKCMLVVVLLCDFDIHRIYISNILLSQWFLMV